MSERDDANPDDLTDEEREAVLAAAALALTPDAGRMPPAARDRVEAEARAFAARRAKAHARARAETSEPRTDGAPGTTTAAGSQVVVLDEEREARQETSRPSRALQWAGWAAAAAALVVVIARERATATSAAPLAQELAFTDEGTAVTMTFDRRDGRGTVTWSTDLGAKPDELVELWIRFDGDEQPRLAGSLVAGSGRAIAFAGLCAPNRTSLSCAEVREVVLTREAWPGAAVLRASQVVARGPTGVRSR